MRTELTGRQEKGNRMEQVAIEIITEARASVDNEISEVLSMLERI